MRVTLVFPNFDAPLGVSIGLSYVAASLQAAGHAVAAIHVTEQLGYAYDFERVMADIEASRPGLVGIGCGFNHYPEMRRVAEAVETRLAAPVVLGGVHATLNADRVLEENPRLSYVNVGEGEASMTELADALEKGRDTTRIANVQARVAGRIHRNRVRPFADLSALPPMATDIWEFQRVIDLRRGWVNVSSQRGCPYRCTYCHNNGLASLYSRETGVPSANNAALGFLRYRAPRPMVDELKGIRDRYDMQAFSFIDDTFTMNPPWLFRLLDLYRDEVGVPFVCNTTAVNLDEDIVGRLAGAGCRLVRMGVESGSVRLRSQLMKRPFPESKIRWAFREVQRADMQALAFNMIGNVGETRDETLETFRFNASLRPTSMKLSLVHPYPGTEYEDVARRENAVDPSRSAHNFIESSILRRGPEEALWLDKVRTFYFWYVNRFLENEAAPIYAKLVADLEALDEGKWADEDTRRGLWDRHHETSAALQSRSVDHYTAPFPERPDLTVSALVAMSRGEIIRRERADPH